MLKKLSFLIVPLCFLLPSGAHAVTIAEANSLSSGLVGYWTFDGAMTNWATGSALDSSGNGYSGILASLSTTTSPSPGKIGQALRFNSSAAGQMVTLGDNYSPASGGSWTYSIWAKPIGDGNSGYLFAKYENDVGSGLFIRASGGNLWGCVSNFGACSVSSTPIKQNVWQLITLVYNANNTTLYIYQDGTQVFSQVQTPVANTKDFTIGNRYLDDRRFNGWLDDMRIYNRALSAQEVAQLYKTGAATIAQSNTTSISSGLISHWTLDGSKTNWSTGRTQDSSGNGNTGSLSGFSTTTSPVAGKVGQGLAFSSTSPYVLGANTVNTPLVTESVWVYFTQFPFVSGVADRGLIMGFSNGGTHDKEIIIDQNGKVYFYIYDGTPRCTSVPSSGISLNQWHLLTATADGTTARVYVDGVQVGSVGSGNTFTGYSSSDIYLGSGWGTGSVLCGGSLGNALMPGTRFDDARVYSRALSVQEIQELYKTGAVTIAKSNTTSLSTGLVGYWTFDGAMTNWATGSALDSSGNGYSGILASLSTTTSPSPGKIGQALRFNSSAAGQMVTLGDNYSPASGGSWTYSIWAKPIGDGNSGYLFAKYENDVGSGLFIRASGGNLWGCVSNFGACSVSSTPIKQNVWQLITLVYNANNTTLYIYQDGTQVFSQVQTPVANTKDFTIGNRYLDDRRFNGWLDDMRIYNRALSAQEVKELYNATK